MIDLHQKMLENSMSDAANYNAQAILTNLNSVYGESEQPTASINPPVDKELEAGYLDKVAEVVGHILDMVVIDKDTHQPDLVQV